MARPHTARPKKLKFTSHLTFLSQLDSYRNQLKCLNDWILLIQKFENTWGVYFLIIPNRLLSFMSYCKFFKFFYLICVFIQPRAIPEITHATIVRQPRIPQSSRNYITVPKLKSRNLGSHLFKSQFLFNKSFLFWTLTPLSE